MNKLSFRNQHILNGLNKFQDGNRWILSGLFVLSFLGLTFFTLQYGVDDSFITFRYAKNLVQHGVWNWNQFGPKVEAYTNFTYAVLALIPEALGMSSFIFFKAVGFLCLAYLVWRLYRILHASYAFWLALTFVLLNPLFYIHAYSGLETPLFFVLLFELIVALSIDLDRQSDKKLFFIMLFLALTRPEGALYSIVGFLYFINKRKKIDSKYTFASIFLGATLYFYIRYSYFGQLLPNTFYVKSNIPFELGRGLEYLKTSKEFWSFILLFFLVKNTGFRILVACSLAVNFLYAFSDLQMNFADRFPFQTLAPFYLAAIVLLVKSQHLLKMAFLIVLFLAMVWSSQSLSAIASDYPMLRKAHGTLGVVLSKYKDENLTLMVGDVGLIPYYAEWQTVDFVGLANKQIAREGLTLSSVAQMNPDLILIYGSSGSEPQQGFESVRNQKPIMEYLKNNDNYEYCGAVKLNDSFYLLAYLKKSIKKFNEIKASIEQVEFSSRNAKFNQKQYLQFHYLTRPDQPSQ